MYPHLEGKEANKRTGTERIEWPSSGSYMVSEVGIPFRAKHLLEKLVLGTKQKHCWLFCLSFPCSAAGIPPFPRNPGCCVQPCPLDELYSFFIEESALMQVRDIIIWAQP